MLADDDTVNCAMSFIDNPPPTTPVLCLNIMRLFSVVTSVVTEKRVKETSWEKNNFKE